MSNYFEELSKVDCSKHVEKKGKFTYLSWTYAVAELLKRHPEATWRVIEDEHGWPFWQTVCGYFVKVGVTVNGVERVQVHPILDGNNKPIAEPNAFHVNTSIQRGLVKAIALHGLGLYIYSGEDLPDGAVQDDKASAWIDAITSCVDLDALETLRGELTAAGLDGAVLLKVRAAFSARKNALTPKAKAAA